MARVLSSLGVCGANASVGELRVDVNVSVGPSRVNQGPRTEVKNVNGIRGVAQAIEYEIDRQMKLFRSGEKPINETRSYDPTRGLPSSQTLADFVELNLTGEVHGSGATQVRYLCYSCGFDLIRDVIPTLYPSDIQLATHVFNLTEDSLRHMRYIVDRLQKELRRTFDKDARFHRVYSTSTLVTYLKGRYLVLKMNK
ncbi:unnamed protein product [Echinostoma caproni]|uniref:Aspartyl/Glutamyl-tRNA(Gln) amidotransferase subunit B/E catalytic domain-containing protein n=1 Tax=Echinostoma caproni TaxID=27848 RepID=A0A3P8IW56_9TREM|nr:unnamed protein product [Echinostoma caproni]